jgi:hypothetical protein
VRIEMMEILLSVKCAAQAHFIECNIRKKYQNLHKSNG